MPAGDLKTAHPLALISRFSELLSAVNTIEQNAYAANPLYATYGLSNIIGELGRKGMYKELGDLLTSLQMLVGAQDDVRTDNWPLDDVLEAAEREHREREAK